MLQTGAIEAANGAVEFTDAHRLRSMFGMIAEEVAKVNPNLVVRDENGQVYTVRYDAVNAMLLNEFLKEHRMWSNNKRLSRDWIQGRKAGTDRYATAAAN